MQVNKRAKSRALKMGNHKTPMKKNPKVLEHKSVCQRAGEGNSFIGHIREEKKKKKNLVGACNLATANDTWMVTVRRWEECECVFVCDMVWVCSENVCFCACLCMRVWWVRESARMVWRFSQVMNLKGCRQKAAERDRV